MCSVVVILVVCLENRNRSVTKYIQVPVVKKIKQTTNLATSKYQSTTPHQTNQQFVTKIAQNNTTLAKS